MMMRRNCRNVDKDIHTTNLGFTRSSSMRGVRLSGQGLPPTRPPGERKKSKSPFRLQKSQPGYLLDTMTSSFRRRDGTGPKTQFSQDCLHYGTQKKDVINDELLPTTFSMPQNLSAFSSTKMSTITPSTFISTLISSKSNEGVALRRPVSSYSFTNWREASNNEENDNPNLISSEIIHRNEEDDPHEDQDEINSKKSFSMPCLNNETKTSNTPLSSSSLSSSSSEDQKIMFDSIQHCLSKANIENDDEIGMTRIAKKSLSFRRGNELKNLTSSYVTPISSTLVINSLAYQVLPERITNQIMRSRQAAEFQRQQHAHMGSYSSAGCSSNSSSNQSLSSPIHSSNASFNQSHRNNHNNNLVSVHFKQSTISDDEYGHLAYTKGDVIDNRYEIISTLGEGTFGKVAKVRDMKENTIVALKIIKNSHKYREAAKLEVNVLQSINKIDPFGKYLCVTMLDSFNYFGHMCLTFEVLGESVFDFLKNNYYLPYSIDDVRHISYQLCVAVKFMHDNKITHTDLKPENILFVSNDWYGESVSVETRNGGESMRIIRRMRDTRIKLIDFGSATFEWEHHSSIVSTRHYRAPEVIMDLGWSHPCDVWSIGCIIFELFHGLALFQTHDNAEHLAMMEKTTGRKIPTNLAKKSPSKYFHRSTGKLIWDRTRSQSNFVNENCTSLHVYYQHPELLQKRHYHNSKSMKRAGSVLEIQQLCDLVIRILVFDPQHRVGLKHVLQHSFFDRLQDNFDSRKSVRLQF